MFVCLTEILIQEKQDNGLCVSSTPSIEIVVE